MEGKPRVAVTAVGVVSPLGPDAAAQAVALREGRAGIGPVTAFDAAGYRAREAGQVRTEWLEGFGPRGLHPAGRMMVRAARELAAADPGFRPEMAVVGTTSGGMSFGESFLKAILAGRADRRAPAWLANYQPHKAVLDALGDRGWRVPFRVVATACASGADAVGQAFDMIRAGRCRRVLCGGFDALSELVFAGFDCLQASTAEICRPFDRGRSGLVLGEAAALLALESWEEAEARGAPVFAEIAGYGTAADTHHLTQPHPSGIGPRLAMERALASAGLGPEAIGYVNAHGTATPLNDASEGAAISALLPPGTPVSSTKAMTGHTLGAAGALEAVFTAMALREGVLPPNLHFCEPEPGWTFRVVPSPEPTAARWALSNSLGFGGSNAALVIGRGTA
jgi:3-oxoacyl-[acyl-carrier-protein] synthase II